MDTSPLQECTSAFVALRTAGHGLFPPPPSPNDLKTSILLMHSIEQWARVQGAALLAEAEARQAWAGSGYRNAAEWLAGETKSNAGAAKRKAKLGKAIKKSKKLKDALDNGDVSPDTAEQIADTINEPPAGANEESLDSLVDACKGATPSDARDAATLFNDLYKEETDEEAAARRYNQRCLSFGQGRDGMVPVSGSLPADMADQIKKSALHAAGTYTGDTRSTEQKLADGVHHMAFAHARGELTGGREAPQMLIVMSEATWRGTSSEPAYTDLGTKIPAHEARRLAEFADLQRVVKSGSEILDLGRTERYATLAQYRALVARDGGCTAGDCNIPAAWCEVDHIIDWEHGGVSDLINYGLKCSHHHHMKHQPGAVTTGNGENWTTTLPDGTIIHRTAKNQNTRFAPGAAPGPDATESAGRFEQADLFGDGPPDPTQAAA